MINDLSKAELPYEIKQGIAKVGRRISSFGVPVFRINGLYQPAMHLLRNNGKYMRPTLVLMGARILGKRIDDFIDIAVAAELLHVSSLVHDDIVDGDRKRRGVDSVHIKYGSETAILAGDALISKAIRLSAGYGEGIMKLISDATMDMCAGEIMDYDCQSRRRVPSLAEYKDIARLKSASLIATCCSIAAVYSKNKKVARKLYDFGERIGIAFQMRDDVMDFALSHGSGKAAADRYRPNVVATLMKRGSVSKSSAIARATELNNNYINAAIMSMDGIKGADSLIRYADKIRVR